MNVKELNLKYAIVKDAAPFKYRLWKNNKVVKTGSTDKDSEQAMTQWANGTGVAWDKVSLHDPKWKQLKVSKNPNATTGATAGSSPRDKAPKSNIIELKNDYRFTIGYQSPLYPGAQEFRIVGKGKTPEEAYKEILPTLVGNIKKYNWGKVQVRKCENVVTGQRSSIYFRVPQDIQNKDVDKQFKEFSKSKYGSSY